MKKFDPEIIKVDKIVYGGQGLGELPDGRKIFVWGALSGETVRVEITKSKKSYAEGNVIEILESSPERVEPHDECYLSTSPWQIMNFAAEQKYKAQLVADAFEQYGTVIARSKTMKQSSNKDLDRHADKSARDDELQVLTDNKVYLYRNKMEYALWWDNDTSQISLAFHKRGSHQKIPITKSSIEYPEIFAEAQQIVDKLNAGNEEARKYQLLLVRANQNREVSSALFENGQAHPVMTTLADTICGYKYSYSPNGFFQINLPVYEMALREISKFIATEKVVDMYAGVGTIGLSVARDKKLTLVETNSSAFAEMAKNIPVDAPNINPICSKSEDALGYISSDATLIIDPPRAGLDEKVVMRILESLPPSVIYLSCNPITQARDIKPLLEKYKIIHTQSFNFFPRTPHIENLVVLELLR